VDVEFSGRGQDPVSMQWDGGPTYSIHGYSTRRLPDLHLTGLEHVRTLGPPRINVMVLADGGYRRLDTITVDLIVNDKSLYPQQRDKPRPEWV